MFKRIRIEVGKRVESSGQRAKCMYVRLVLCKAPKSMWRYSAEAEFY